MSFYLLLILATIIILIILFILTKIDMNTDYSNQSIPYFFCADNGFFINVPYFNWQINKRRFIEENFNEEITYEGKQYIITAIFKDRPHSHNNTERFPDFFYKDYVATVELKTFSKNISNITQIFGNNNTVTIEQNDIYNITNSIDALLQSDISDADKQSLELFKLKLLQNNCSEKDKTRVLSTLTKLSKFAPYASLASAIINLVKSLLP